ncbi:LA_2478/LA_2722/LA_4182 family protein [Leptospira vanthielii]|uniref:Lipoprotein n=1 Tax=Leptospira vanthielii TaxID=293085 RepID=A0ABY2NMR2_9LEPT|nr:hypothetical protein [Leptospira vanthielii]TGM52474.1 hypothetical protein EHQ95_12490 [Leptospira vanthielii]
MKFKSIIELIFERDKRNTHIAHGLGNKREAVNVRGRWEIKVSAENKRNTYIPPAISFFKRITIKIPASHLTAFTDLKLVFPIFLSSLILVFLISCKKDKGIMNVDWQNESLSLTAEICAKYRECADKEWKSIPENLKKFTEGRLEETQCQKRFRESNAYKLLGADPLAIQTAYKDCHKQILQFSCKDLQEGKIETVSSCEVFQKIQNGN